MNNSKKKEEKVKVDIPLLKLDEMNKNKSIYKDFDKKNENKTNEFVSMNNIKEVNEEIKKPLLDKESKKEDNKR